MLRRMLLCLVLGSLAGGLAAAPAMAATAYTGQASPAMTSATAYGYVDPQAARVDYWFVYGTTTQYGQTTRAGTLAPGSRVTLIAAQLSPLRAATRYHYRLFVLPLDSSGKPEWASAAVGQDETFTTTRGELDLISTRLAVSHGSAGVRIRCASTLPCTAVLRIHMASGSADTRTVSCGAGRVSLAPGARRTVTLRLSSGCVARLAAARGHRLSAVLSASVSTGQTWAEHNVSLVG